MSCSSSRRLVFKKRRRDEKGEPKKKPGPKPATRGKVTKGKATTDPEPKPQQTAEEVKKFDDNDRKLVESCGGPNRSDEDEINWFFNTDLLYLRFRIHELPQTKHKRCAAEEEEVEFSISDDTNNLGMDISDPHFAFSNAPAILNAKKRFDSTHTYTVDLPRSVFPRKWNGFS